MKIFLNGIEVKELLQFCRGLGKYFEINVLVNSRKLMIYNYFKKSFVRPLLKL